MSWCAFPSCSDRKDDEILTACSTCRKSFCSAHTRPDVHHCPGAGAVTSSSYKTHLRQQQPKACPICGVMVQVRRGQDPDVAMDAHIQAGCPAPTPFDDHDEMPSMTPSSSRQSSLDVPSFSAFTSVSRTRSGTRGQQNLHLPSDPLDFRRTRSSEKMKEQFHNFGFTSPTMMGMSSNEGIFSPQGDAPRLTRSFSKLASMGGPASSPPNNQRGQKRKSSVVAATAPPKLKQEPSVSSGFPSMRRTRSRLANDDLSLDDDALNAAASNSLPNTLPSFSSQISTTFDDILTDTTPYMLRPPSFRSNSSLFRQNSLDPDPFAPRMTRQRSKQGPGSLFDRGKSQDGLVLEDPEPDPPMFAQPRLTRTRSKQQGIALPPMENMMHEHDEMMKRKHNHDEHQHHHQQQPIQPQPHRPQHVQPIYGKQASQHTQHIQHTSHPHIPTSTSYGAYPTNPTFSPPEVILQRQQDDRTIATQRSHEVTRTTSILQDFTNTNNVPTTIQAVNEPPELNTRISSYRDEYGSYHSSGRDGPSLIAASARRLVPSFVTYFLAQYLQMKSHPPISLSGQAPPIAPIKQLTPIQHYLLQPLCTCIQTVADALLLNELEMVVWCMYLEKLEPRWISMDQPVMQLRTLFYSAYAMKLTFTEDHQNLLPYLTAIYPDFSPRFSAWLHSKPHVKLGLAPVKLNARFLLLSQFAANNPHVNGNGST